MKNKNGAKKWPFGFGILYLMVHFPFVVAWKIGITGLWISKRVKSIDDDMPGFPIPIAFAIIPFAFQVEQFLHELCQPFRINFYKGSGHTEWFWFVCIVPALAIITGSWIGYAALFDWYFGTDLVGAVGGGVAQLLSVLINFV